MTGSRPSDRQETGQRRQGSGQYKLAALGWLATVTTSLAFVPALSQQRSILIGAVLSAAVVLVGVGLRLLRTRGILVLLAQMVTVVEWLVLGYGKHLKYGVLPTGRTLSAFGDQIDTGMAVAQHYAAPAPPNVGLLIMVAFFIAVVAAFVDFFAAGLRRAPLAGLPLLALYTVPVAALPDGVPFYYFVPGALSYLALLMADERHRLAHWGRLVTRSVTPSGASAVMDSSGLTASGRRITTLAMLTAVFVPVGVPVLSTTVWGRESGIGNGPGSGLTFNDPMVSLATSLRRPSPVDLLTVTSDTPPEYLRLTVLDQPGPDAWTASPVDAANTVPLTDIPPRPPGLSATVSTSPHSMTIAVEDAFPTDTSWLPVPYLVRSLNTGGFWDYVPADQTVAADTARVTDRIPAYDVAYQTMAPTADQLRGASPAPADIVARYGDVPAGVPSVVAATARRATAGATTDYERALLLQSFFRDHDNFSYDVTVGYGYGYDAMAKFLQQRRGFCQQFAATMAMLARTLDIPSRVVVGFLQPARSTTDSTYVFTSDSAHSWPELYFGGVGWVRFEPTQGVGAPFPQWADRRPTPNVSSNEPTIVRPTIGQPGASSASTTTGPLSNAGGDGRGGSASLPSKGWLVPLGALAVLLLPASLRLGVRRSRFTRPLDAASAAEAAWLELRDYLRDLHQPWPGSMSPRARQRSIEPLVRGDGEAVSALQRLAQCVERARYAATVPAEMAPAADAATVIAAISRHTNSRKRLRALLWPSSLRADVQSAWARLTAGRTEPGD